MSLYFPIPLGDVHSELSSLLYAVQEGLKDFGVTVEIRYNQYTYLDVMIDIWATSDNERMRVKIEGIVARLQHGILWGEYDYRFQGVAHPTLEHLDGYDKFEIVARVDLGHWPHRRPHGWEVVSSLSEWYRRFTRAPSWWPTGRRAA